MQDSEYDKNHSDESSILEKQIIELKKSLTYKDSQLEKSKNIEKQLNQANAILNSILEGPANIIAFSLDQNYRYIFFNQSHKQTMKNIWGVDIEIGQSILDYISYPEDKEKAKFNFDRALSGENFIEIEAYGEESLSRNYWEDIYSPIQSNEEIIGVNIFCIDITERYNSEQALKESEEKFRSVAESAIDAIITVDSQGFISFFNHSLLDLFGYSSFELKEQPISLLIPERYKGEHLKGMAKYKSGITHRTGKTTIAAAIKKDGTEFPCEMSLSIWKSGEDTYFTSIICDLTERQKAEKALKKSEEKYRAIFENIQDIFYQTDVSGNIIDISPSVERYIGYNREELVGKQVDILYFNLEQRNEILNALYEQGEVIDYELLLKDKKDNKIYASTNAHFIFDSDNQPRMIEGSIRDITKRKKAENQLKLSQIRLKNALDLANLANWELDISTNEFIFNDRFYSMIGTTVEDESGYNVPISDYIKKYVHPDDATFIDDGIKKSLNVRKPLFGSEFEHRIINKDGNIIYVAIRIKLIPPTDTRSVYVYGTVQDITDRKKAEEELIKSEEKYRLLVESARDPIVIANKEGVLTMANTSGSETLNLTVDDIIGKNVYDLFPDNADELMSILKKILKTGKGGEFELPIKYHGQEIWFSMSIQPFINPDGSIEQVQIIARDITNIKETQKKLELALEEKEMLLKEIHHRVKNNLMVISSLLSIQSRYIKDKAALDVFRESQNRAKSMALIHEKLYRSTDLKNIDFGEYIRTFAIDLYHSIVTDSSLIKLEMDVESVMLDINTAIPLGLIVNELITNSLKHAFPDGRKGKINVDFYHHDGYFVLSVKDDGVGFPEDLDFKNTGSLGLQLVNSLTDQIDGEVKLDRTEGTEFKVTFKEIKFSK